MREETRIKPQPGLLPGMLKRTKYSRLRNDSVTSLDDHPQTSQKGDLCLHSDFAPLASGTPPGLGPSDLRDYLPHVKDRVPDKPGDGIFPAPRGLHARPSLLCTKRPITLHRMASHPCPTLTQHREHLCCLKPLCAADDWTAGRLSHRAVHHHIKYMGSVEVTQSMRTLDFDTRMQVTREAISRLCEKTSAMKTKRTASKGPSAVLGEINRKFFGSSVILTVSTDSVTLIAASSLQKVAHHPMQSISFASGGDPDMVDYIAYVAKDLFNQRACHILECPRGRASEVINSIGQAFETRFRQLLGRTSTILSPRSGPRICPRWSTGETPCQKTGKGNGIKEKEDYYNVVQRRVPPLCGTETKRRSEDLREVCLTPPILLYENSSVSVETSAPPAADLVQPWIQEEECTSAAEGQDKVLIQEEGWFHGRLGRAQAESLLNCSGDFLVRESSSASGQYVLSGMEGATVRHLLLVDPFGQVRTRDLVFRSIGHLVRFHMEKQLPIISGSSELCLKQPILQTH